MSSQKKERKVLILKQELTKIYMHYFEDTHKTPREEQTKVGTEKKPSAEVFEDTENFSFPGQ